MKRFKVRQAYLAFMMLILSVIIAGCGSNGQTGHWLPNASPTVSSTSPADTNIVTDVCINLKEINATFDKAMDPTTINSDPAGTLLTFTLKETVSGTNVPGTVAMNAPINTIATFTPTANLTSGLNYTVTIKGGATGVKDVDGHALAVDKVWSFTVGTDICAVVIPPITGGILAPYAIASYGGITNVGATKINGDAVLDPNHFCNGDAVGTTNDFGLCTTSGDPLANNMGDLVITNTWDGSAANTTAADAVMVALLAKWNSITMAGLPGGTDLGCGTIGSSGAAGVGIGCAGNYTLPPGVYISSTHSTIDITGDLILDGGGDPNAVFVFQVPSAALTATPGASGSSQGDHVRIILINGAKASNVWWQVGSSATIGDYAEFQGNVLASASISMLTGATSCGRLLAGAGGGGAFSFLGNTVSVPGNSNAPATGSLNVPAICQ